MPENLKWCAAKWMRIVKLTVNANDNNIHMLDFQNKSQAVAQKHDLHPELRLLCFLPLIIRRRIIEKIDVKSECKVDINDTANYIRKKILIKRFLSNKLTNLSSQKLHAPKSAPAKISATTQMNPNPVASSCNYDESEDSSDSEPLLASNKEIMKTRPARVCPSCCII